MKKYRDRVHLLGYKHYGRYRLLDLINAIILQRNNIFQLQYAVSSSDINITKDGVYIYSKQNVKICSDRNEQGVGCIRLNVNSDLMSIIRIQFYITLA
jgi:hypothetical protein